MMVKNCSKRRVPEIDNSGDAVGEDDAIEQRYLRLSAAEIGPGSEPRQVVAQRDVAWVDFECLYCAAVHAKEIGDRRRSGPYSSIQASTSHTRDL